MKIFITETQFKKLRKFLTEITIEKAYIDIYSKFIPQEDFDEIVAADPYSKPNFLSPSAKWLLDLYKNKKLKLEDLPKATKYIDTFNKVKSRLPIEKRDINKFKSLPDMFVIIQPYLESGEEIQSNTSLEKEIKQKETKRLFEDNNWLVVQPLSERAACYYGKNTEWCTAAKNDNRFNYYDTQGPLYINIDKINNKKYQFHFESSQFMDENDSEIDLFNLMNRNPTLKTFYNNFLKDKVKNVKFSDLIINDTGCYIFVKDWSEFSDAFETNRNHSNPADFLNELQDDYWDYTYSKNDLEYDFNKINQSNLKYMIDLLIKNGDITQESDSSDIKEAILDDDELFSAIEKAMSWVSESADKDAAHDSIVSEIKDYFNITEIKYLDKGIVLKMSICPEPILLYTISDADFITGYSNLHDKIDYNFPYYGFQGQGNVDWTQFNEYLSDNLSEL